MLDQEAVLRYIKVKALADQGIPGERENAQRKVVKMEAEYPGIRQEAERLARAQSAGSQHKKTGNPLNPFINGQVDWEKVAGYAQTLYEGFSGFAETVTNTQAGLSLAQEVESDLKVARTGAVQFILKFDPLILGKAQQLSGAQREAFKQGLHNILRDQLDSIFSALDMPVEDED